nr:hypothetical protein [uncultured Solibaculum sp.]
MSSSAADPFVGAGLSAFCYPSWDKALLAMADSAMDECHKREIRKQIEARQLLAAADNLKKYLGEKRLAAKLLSLFNLEKLKPVCETLSRQAVFLLLYLFPRGPVITTNFDRVLEKVY